MILGRRKPTVTQSVQINEAQNREVIRSNPP